MGKEKRPEQPAAADRALLRWRRFDALLRMVTLLAFAAFVLAAGWQLRLIQQQLDRIEQQRTENLYWRITRPGTQPDDRTEAFLRLVAADNKEWGMAFLKDMDLRKAHLSGTSLQNAHFESCDFRDAEMYGVKMYRGQFHTSSLTGTDLQHADLREAEIFRSTFRNANLRRAQLSKASLEQSTFRKCNLSMADMPEAYLLQARFEDCNLSGANLTGANLQDAKFIRTNLHLARLPNANLRNVDFTDSNWWKARGLPAEVIDEFKKRFPPSSNAPKEIRQEWELWLKTGG